MRRRARTVVAAALATVALVLIGDAALATPRHPAFPPGRPTRVLALGDSVLLGAADDLVADLPGRDVVVDAQVSRSTGAGARAAAAHGTDWDVVILFLGHNDGATAGVYQPPYRAMLDEFAAVPRVVVVTVHEVRPYYPGVNAFLRSEAVRYPNVRVADWNAAVRPGMTAADGLHLTGAGRAALGQLLADQVAFAEVDFLPTTTAPPTTAAPTTAAPTTSTSAAVSLIPPISIDRDPASTTTTTDRPSATAADGAADDEPGPSVAAPGPTPWGVWVALALGAIVMAVVLVRSLDPPGRDER